MTVISTSCCCDILLFRDGLWNAEYEGGVVNRYNLAPALHENTVQGPNSLPITMSVPIPVKQTTCPCIGGPDGNLLFVTTGSNFYFEDRYTEEPMAGQLFIHKLPTSEYFVSGILFRDHS